MSKYTIYYYTRKTMYRDFATTWAKLASDIELTEERRRGMTLFFKPIAKRFGLVKEFKEIGVI